MVLKIPHQRILYILRGLSESFKVVSPHSIKQLASQTARGRKTFYIQMKYIPLHFELGVTSTTSLSGGLITNNYWDCYFCWDRSGLPTVQARPCEFECSGRVSPVSLRMQTTRHVLILWWLGSQEFKYPIPSTKLDTI